MAGSINTLLIILKWFLIQWEIFIFIERFWKYLALAAIAIAIFAYIPKSLDMRSSNCKDWEEGQVQEVSATFMWKIENFSVLSDIFIRSPKLEVAGQSYFLKLYKNRYLEIRLNRDVGPKLRASSLRIRWKVNLVDSRGFQHYLKTNEIMYDKENEVQEMKGQILVKIPESYLEMYKKFVSPRDTLTMSFKATIVSKDDSNDVPLREDTSSLLETLSSDLGRLCVNQLDSDVVLISGDTSFPAHRAILSSRSSVFAVMFQHDTLEKQKGEVVISDVEAGTLKTMLYYIYTGEIREQNATTAVLMYIAAEKFALHELKQESRKYILATLSPENICDIADLFYTYEDQTIMNAVVEFLRENREEILKSKQWQYFMDKKPKAANNLLSSALLRV